MHVAEVSISRPALPVTKLSDYAMHYRFPILEALKVIFKREYVFTVEAFPWYFVRLSVWPQIQS